MARHARSLQSAGSQKEYAERGVHEITPGNDRLSAGAGLNVEQRQAAGVTAWAVATKKKRRNAALESSE
jgi:hypothetical protein